MSVGPAVMARNALTSPEEPRRDRKKRQIRDALIDAALELFETKGYEHTAIREITDAVDVAERTFFRYFASKEDLALYFMEEEVEAFEAALAARPPHEGPVTAVRYAFRSTMEQLVADPHELNGEPRYLAVIRLIDSTPALLAASLRYVYDNGDRLVRVLGDRVGVDPETDHRPSLLIAIYSGLMALVHREWRTRGRCGAEEMITLFDTYADELSSTVTDDWKGGAPVDARTGVRRPVRGRERRS